LGIIIIFRSLFLGTRNFHKLLYLIIIASIFSVAISAIYSIKNPTVAFYFMPSRFWELAAGASLFLLFASGTLKPFLKIFLISNGLQIISVILILSSFFFTDPTTEGFPFPWAMISVLGTVFLIASGASGNGFITRILSLSGFVYLGKISYSLYLWHWPIGTVMRWTIGLDSFLKIGLYVLLIGIASLMSYYLIEKPLRYQKGTLVVLIPITAAIVFTVFLSHDFNSKFLKKSYLFGEIASIMPENHFLSMNCHDTQPRDFKRCFTPRRTINKPNAIYLIGDSHAAGYVPMLEEFEKDTDFELLQLTGGPVFIHKQGRSGEMGILLNHFEQYLKEGDIIVASSHRAYTYYGQESQKVYSALLRGQSIDVFEKTKKPLSSTLTHLMRLIDIVSKRKSSLILIGDVPMLASSAIIGCLLQKRLSGKSLCDVPLLISRKHAEPLNNLYQKLSEKDHVYFWNPHDLLCGNSWCRPYKDLQVNYLDAGHISQIASKSLFPYFNNFIISNQNGLNINRKSIN